MLKQSDDYRNGATMLQKLPNNGPAATPKARATRVTILMTAARLFAEKGYSDCSLRDIADQAGMKAGSVYYHFASKDELLEEVLLIGVMQLRRNVDSALERLGPDAPMAVRLRHAMRAHVVSFLDVKDDANTYLRIYEYLPPALKRRSLSARLDYARLWRHMLEEGQKTGIVKQSVDLGVFVPFFLQALNRVPDWFSPSRMTIDGVCDVIFQTTIENILNLPEATAR